MNSTHYLVAGEGLRSQLVRALVFGGLAGILETVLVLSTGYGSPAVIVYNFGLLVLVFCSATLLSVLGQRWSCLRWLSTNFVLLFVGILIFAVRGCVQDCGDQTLWRVAFPTGIALLSALAMGWSHRSRPQIGERASFVIATVAMTLAALDFAARDENLASGMAPLALLLMVALGTAGSVMVSRGWIPSLIFTLIGALGCFGWSLRDANQIGRPLEIEPLTTRQSTPIEKNPPNVLLIVMDTVRAEHLGLYGYSRRTSPYLDALAKESLVFDHAIASGNFTLPSHGSLFTGLLPSEHGARPRWGDVHRFRGMASVAFALRPDVATLAEYLRARGFATGGLSANTAYLAPWTGLQRGFERFSDRPKHLIGYHPLSYPLAKRLGLAAPDQFAFGEWEGTFVSQAAFSFASRTTSPFFLFLNYFDAHAANAVRERYRLHDDSGGDMKALQFYDSQIALIDTAIETLLESLKRAGGLTNTILVITSDHGEFFGERGGLGGHAKGAYEEVLHVPLLVRFPERLSAGRVQKAFGLHQVHRVILDLVEGRSIDWVQDEPEQPQVLSQVWGRVTGTDPIGRPASLEPDANVIYAGSHKLIARSSGQDELYDLATDSGEERNLLLQKNLSTMELRERMLDALKKLGPARPGSEPNPSTADLERLRALGYIAGKNSKPREH